MRNTIAVMGELGIRRIVTLSFIGAGGSRPHAPWFMRLMMKLTNFKIVFAGHERQEQQRGHAEISLVGTDIGMMVAYAYAASYPREVRRLVLAELLIPGFGLEERMNSTTSGYWHFGLHMQGEVATVSFLALAKAG